MRSATRSGLMRGVPRPVKKIGQGPGDRLDVFSSFAESQQVHRTVPVDAGVRDEEIRITMLIVGKRDRTRRQRLAIGMERFFVKWEEQVEPDPAGSVGLDQIEMT